MVVLSRETGLAAYEVSHLWLSRHLDVELVILDRRLALADMPE